MGNIQQILAQIAAINTLQNLGDFIHTGPVSAIRLGSISEQEYSTILKAIEVRRRILKDKKYITGMTVEERDKYISLYSKPTYMQQHAELVVFAQQLQQAVRSRLSASDSITPCDSKSYSLDIARSLFHRLKSIETEPVDFAVLIELNANAKGYMLNDTKKFLQQLEGEEHAIIIAKLNTEKASLTHEIHAMEREFCGGMLCEHRFNLMICLQLVKEKIKRYQTTSYCPHYSAKINLGNIKPTASDDSLISSGTSCTLSSF